MRWIVDCHVHFYPGYDLVAAFDAFIAHLREQDHGAPAMRGAILCERHDCTVFSTWKKQHKISPVTEVLRAPEDNSLLLRHRDEEFFLIAGRQINSAERLEFLAYGIDDALPNGLPWPELVKEIYKRGGLPVLNWAFGKWLFARKPIAQAIVDSFGPAELALCDTTLRANRMPEPAMMRQERDRGRRIFAGSDPLPAPTEEAWLGAYGISWEGPEKSNAPFAELRRFFQSSEAYETWGKRTTISEFLTRQFFHTKG